MLDSYHFLLVLSIVVLGYTISYICAKQKIISLLKHRMIWNYLLLITFLLSGLLGLIMAFLIDYKYSIEWYKEAMWVHVEFGIAMTVILIFHIIWHSKYYLNYLSHKKIGE